MKNILKNQYHKNKRPGIAASPVHLNGATGEPLTARFVRIEMKGRTLRGLLGKIDQRRVYFVNGEVQTGKIEPIANIDLYQPVTYSGQTMTLRYARAQELGPWLDLVAVRGEAAVMLGVGEEREVERIPAQLRGFL